MWQEFIAPEMQKRMEAEYERCVLFLMAAVSKEFGDIGKADENTLFTFMAKVLQSAPPEGLGASFSDSTPFVYPAVLSKRLGSYASAVLSADAFTRMHKRMSLFFDNSDVIIAGTACAFNAMADPGLAAFPLRNIGLLNKKMQELGLDALLSAEYVNIGIFLSKLGDPEGSLGYFDKALAAHSNFAYALSSKGAVLFKMDRREEAFECFNKASAILR
jgi:tetratricopeptide (TPR) repeat protein